MAVTVASEQLVASMSETAALMRAWRLGTEDSSDEVASEFEALLPTLVATGYAEADEHTWHFTPQGVARAELLVPEDGE